MRFQTVFGAVDQFRQVVAPLLEGLTDSLDPVRRLMGQLGDIDGALSHDVGGLAYLGRRRLSRLGQQRGLPLQRRLHGADPAIGGLGGGGQDFAGPTQGA